MGALIHPTAIVDVGAEIDDDVVIGPYCTVSSTAKIGSGTKLISHVVVVGNTSIGKNNTISPFAVLGGKTQDLKFKGGSPGVKIGDNNTIREYVTINAATNDGDYTIVGNDCLIMAYAHIAHCCRIGNQVIIANSVQIAGHVIVEDQATIEGMVGIVQFLRIGRMSFVGGLSKVTKRRGSSEEARKSIKEAYRFLYRTKEPMASVLKRLEKEIEMTKELKLLINFCKSSEKGIIR